MTEYEKIAYAKSFIDMMANGINPINGQHIDEDELINNVRISRCLFYVSSILQKEMEREINALQPAQPPRPKKPKKPKRAKFSITPEECANFEYSSYPLSVTAITRKINWLVPAVINREMEPFSYKKINSWLVGVGFIGSREWEDGSIKMLPTEEGESIGLTVRTWEGHGYSRPVICYSEEAQRFIMDNIEAIVATRTRKERAYDEAVAYYEKQAEMETEIE